MNNYFAGEIELIDKPFTPEDWADFNILPFVDKIRKLAQRYKNRVEIMPYQKQGGKVQLLISGYLRENTTKRKIIVVLIRKTYPKKFDILKSLTNEAIKKLQNLKKTKIFSPISIFRLEKALNKLKSEI